jgi:hypothetical protein
LNAEDAEIRRGPQRKVNGVRCYMNGTLFAGVR